MGSQHFSIDALAVEPTSGDIYYVRGQYEPFSETLISLTLRRITNRADGQGQDVEICTLDAPLQLRFADASYVQP
jgi:hypothetical protein